MARTINIADLRSNPKLANDLMESVKRKSALKRKEEQRRQAEKLFKKKPDTSAILVVTPEDKPEQKLIEKKIVVRHEDEESLSRFAMIDRMMKQAKTSLETPHPSFDALQLLFASAYRYADVKNRSLLAEGRNLCKLALSNESKRDKLKAKLKAKGQDASSARNQLADLSNASIKDRLKKIFDEIFANLKLEEDKKQGIAYNDLHKKHLIDLSRFDTSSNGVVMTRANLMVSSQNLIDIKDVERVTRHITVEVIEHPIYLIKDALLVGFSPSAMPRKVSEDVLEQSMAINFQVRAKPVARMLKHPTSNRTWFYVPEYAKLIIKSISFADKQLNSEFDALKSLSNNPSEDDVRFIFLKLGCKQDKVDEIVKRWAASDSHQTRLTILTNEYATLSRMQKSERLRQKRERFLEENKELTHSVIKSEDRIQQIEEDRSAIRDRFALLASHTGNVEQGLPISRYKHLHEVFQQIERSAVRGNSNAFERRNIRKGILKDRIECRVLKHEHDSMREEAKELKQTIANNQRVLESKRQAAFFESSGR